MRKISDYKILEKIDETRHSTVYRGQKDDENRTVVVKFLKSEFPTRAEIARFKQEYNIIRNLNHAGIVTTYEIVYAENGAALILEDFGGTSLKEMLKTKSISLKSFLHIAITLSGIVGKLHKENVVHKDIKPGNILINKKEKKLKLTGFGIRSVLTHENEEIYDPDIIEGTLAYMSPEQTGRMNRTVDYRTDLYSLGITFYEMLTGVAPFRSDDPMEIIHAHIAIKPVPPNRVKLSIPPIVSDIIMKLLSKNAVERYQNALGIMADLEKCLKQLKTGRKVEAFRLAERDFSAKFNIPQILVGREEEIDILMKSFERVANPSLSPLDNGGRKRVELMLVSGQPGIGKSSLINEIHKPVTEKRGYFISGKYEQFGRNIPYSSIIQAFQGLIKQILSESGERLKFWRENLLKALGPNGKVITKVIPEVELIIGKQPDVQELSPEETQNRFNLVFKNFMQVFSKVENPLVLFLDDLQWADSSSLKLIEMFTMDADLKYLLIIGAYRDNEVSDSHQLASTIETLKMAGVKVSNILLDSLDVTGVNQIISNFLRCEENSSYPLSELVHKKTDGNPFFVNQFFKALSEENILELTGQQSSDGGRRDNCEWEWDLDQIKGMQVTHNVVEMLAGKIIRLHYKTQDLLKICACIGNRFELEMLSVIYNNPIEDTLSELTNAIREDLISIHGDMYRFHHDRIQEAVYSLIPDQEKVKVHNQIGNYMLDKTGEEELQSKILYIVNQLNHGIDSISSEKEKYRLAELNLMAGKKAKTSVAYGPALNYLKKGIGLLSLPQEAVKGRGKSSWDRHYDLTLSLYIEAAEAAYLCAEFDEIDGAVV